MSHKVPWRERPTGCTDVMRYYPENPIIGRYDVPTSNSIFNSVVVPFGDGFVGALRCDSRAVQMSISAGFSRDATHWEVSHEPIIMKGGNTDFLHLGYKYGPRVTFIEDRYWVAWCSGYCGPTIDIAYTFGFKEFFQCENAFLPFNRNGVLFPEKINDKYAMLSYPGDNGHIPFGGIFISYNPDMKYWGERRHVIKVIPSVDSARQCTKIGAGAVPIKTKDDWLLLYHGVINTRSGFRYSTGAALLNLDDPSKVVAHTQLCLLTPATLYETTGDVPSVVFPYVALHSIEGDKVTVYYGAADTVVGIAFGRTSETVKSAKESSL